MSLQDYIESGSIESCVLGLADAAEQAEFERMCADHAEVRAARDAFEASLEASARQGAVAPPAFLRDEIFKAMQVDGETNVATATPAPVIPITYETAEAGWKKYLIAASIILLAGSAALNVYLYNRYQSSNAKYNDLLANQQQMAVNNQSLQTRLELADQDLQTLRDPNMLVVKLADVNKTNSLTTLYWNSQTKDVYLMVNALPAPKAGQQYQLWAIVDGKPVDAGMLSLNEPNALHKMKNIPQAQAFAITLEKEGGSSVPTMTAMFVMGKV